MSPRDHSQRAGTAILHCLREVRWHVLERTYGSSHSTITGLIVDWWVSSGRRRRWALEGGPGLRGTPGKKLPRGAGGRSDVLLLSWSGRGDGLVEVEGQKFKQTVAKIGRFLASTETGYTALTFVLFVAYAYEGPFSTKVEGYLVSQLQRLSQQYATKAFILVVVDKEIPSGLTGWRTRNTYSKGRLKSVHGQLFHGGRQVAGSQCYP